MRARTVKLSVLVPTDKQPCHIFTGRMERNEFYEVIMCVHQSGTLWLVNFKSVATKWLHIKLEKDI